MEKAFVNVKCTNSCHARRVVEMVKTQCPAGVTIEASDLIAGHNPDIRFTVTYQHYNGFEAFVKLILGLEYVDRVKTEFVVA